MKRWRTRKDKIIAQLRRKIIPPALMGNDSSFTYTNSDHVYPETRNEITPEYTSNKEEELNSLFSYDPSLIRKDLVKTVLLSFVAFVTLFVLYVTLS